MAIVIHQVLRTSEKVTFILYILDIAFLAAIGRSNELVESNYHLRSKKNFNLAMQSCENAVKFKDPNREY